MQDLNYGPPSGHSYERSYAPRQEIAYSPIVVHRPVRSVPDFFRVKMANTAIVDPRDLRSSVRPMMVPYSSRMSRFVAQTTPPWMILEGIPGGRQVHTQQTGYQLGMISPDSPPSYISHGYSSTVLSANYRANFPPLKTARRAFSVPAPQRMYMKQVARFPADVRAKLKDDNAATEKQARRKRSQSEVLAHSLSIAGTSSNSNAVYKRLKPSMIIPAKDESRVQGRPFSSSLTARFVLHDDVLSFLGYSTHDRKIEKIVCYDFGGKPRSASCVSESCRGYSSSGIPHSSSGNSGISFPYGSNHGIVLSQLKEISSSILGSVDPVNELNRFLGKKNCSVSLVDFSRYEGMPERYTITNSPSDLSRADLLSTTYCLPSSELKGSMEKLSAEKQPAQKPTEKKSRYSLSSILNDDDSKADRCTQTEEQKDEEVNFHSSVGRAFDIKTYQFIKVIRDSNGRILKLQSIPPPTNENHEIEYTARWIKKTVCYPRYKHDMKIHLVRDDQSFILYKDLNMMLWDIDQENRRVKKSLRPSTKDFLFGENAVYVSIA